MSKPTYYITTAIDYVNSLPHIGTAYEKIGADVLARWHRFQGYDVHFQMGNDEHSINVQRAAEAKKMTPKAYCDEMRKGFESVWKSLDISYDGFIQTSDAFHEKGVQELFRVLEKKGDIYKARYEGWYCESCEAFQTEKELVDGCCPNHKTKAKWLTEENYFFALSKYRDRVLAHIEAHPEFIQPEIRRNEILFLLREGLEDISISRSTFTWGIPLPNDPAHVVYVWFDALINYATAVGFGTDEKRFEKFWQKNSNVVHIIGKDITRFHCVIWPAMLMSAGIALPRTVFGHGFVSFKGEKMSKSLGNVVTPLDVVKQYGADALRYYLLREGSFGRDADFTWEHFIHRYNGDLANGWGNLVSRTLGMISRYCDGELSKPKSLTPNVLEEKLQSEMIALASEVHQELSLEKSDDINFHLALAKIWERAALLDKYINDGKPWELAKQGKTAELQQMLYTVTEGLRVLTVLLFPFLPATAEKTWEACGFSIFGKLTEQTPEFCKKWELIQKISTASSAALFPRIEIPASGGKDSTMEQTPNTAAATSTEKTAPAANAELITIADFAKIDLRVAEIIAAEKVEGADKLLKLQVNLGTETRQIVAGIALHYQAADLIGKKIIVVANLAPAKLRGIESQGMLLAASNSEKLCFVTPSQDIAAGAKVK